MDQNDLNLDLLLKETLELSEFLRINSNFQNATSEEDSFVTVNDDDDYLYDLANSVSEDVDSNTQVLNPTIIPNLSETLFPETSGIIYKIDSSPSTFCVRGFSAKNINEAFKEISDLSSVKRTVLKLLPEQTLVDVCFFETKTFELAEVVREQIINRRFPHQEDAVCNISDPGFSWWMNVSDFQNSEEKNGRFEIFFRSHGINRADKYIQLGPIGDGSVAALRLNQARTLLRSSFPVSEFTCDEKSITVASLKPDHLGFISFKNIFLKGVNNTQLENFPDNSLGRTLYYYFHELAVVRKFWIEVKSKLR